MKPYDDLPCTIQVLLEAYAGENNVAPLTIYKKIIKSLEKDSAYVVSAHYSISLSLVQMIRDAQPTQKELCRDL